MSRYIDTSAEAAHTPQCEHPARHEGEPRGYLAWFDWVEQKSKTHTQKRCPHCERWNIWVPKANRRASGQTARNPGEGE